MHRETKKKQTQTSDQRNHPREVGGLGALLVVEFGTVGTEKVIEMVKHIKSGLACVTAQLLQQLCNH